MIGGVLDQRQVLLRFDLVCTSVAKPHFHRLGPLEYGVLESRVIFADNTAHTGLRMEKILLPDLTVSMQSATGAKATIGAGAIYRGRSRRRVPLRR